MLNTIPEYKHTYTPLRTYKHDIHCLHAYIHACMHALLIYIQPRITRTHTEIHYAHAQTHSITKKHAYNTYITYMHTYMTYMYTYIHTLHKYMHTLYIHTMHTYTRYTYTFIHAYMNYIYIYRHK